MTISKPIYCLVKPQTGPGRTTDYGPASLYFLPSINKIDGADQQKY